MQVKKVYGAPGTGKTTYCIKAVAEELKQRPIDEIAYISYTRAAAQEALDRAIRIAGASLSKTDKGWFTTIHGACASLLFTEGIYIGKTIFSWQHANEFCKRHNLAVPSEKEELQEGGEIGTGTAFFSTRSYLVNTFGNDNEWRQVPHAGALLEYAEQANIEPNLVYSYLKARYDEYKAEKNLVDFEDMLFDEFVMRIPLPVKVMIVDEFQDISPLQKEIVSFWIMGKEKVYIAGDDDQALYGFQGADPSLMVKFPTDEIIVLEKSWRCQEAIWKEAQELIKRNVNRQAKDVASKSAGGQVLWLEGTSIYDLVRYLPKAPSFGEKPKTAYILARTNYLVSKLAWKLSDAHVPFRYLDADKDKLWGLNDKKIRLINWCNSHDSNVYAFQKMARDDGYNEMAIKWMSGFIRRGLPQIAKDGINVSIGTIHSSKGKEADVIIVCTDITPRVAAGMRTPKGLEEERRVWYVAMTRAKERLVVVNKFFSSDSLTFIELAQKFDKEPGYWEDQDGERHWQ